MTPLQKVKYCLIANIGLLFIIIFFIVFCGTDSKYFRFGPNKDFIIISVSIYNYNRYFLLLTGITIMNITKVIIAEIGEPVMVFNVYNPDKKVITDFTKFQLKFYANAMFMISNTRRVFDTMITVTQIDIALFAVLIEQLTSLVTVNLLVNEKVFKLDKYENIPFIESK